MSAGLTVHLDSIARLAGFAGSPATLEEVERGEWDRFESHLESIGEQLRELRAAVASRRAAEGGAS